MRETRINTDLSERMTDCRDKLISHIVIPDLTLIERNFQSAIDSVNQNLAFLEAVTEEGIKDNILRAQIVFLESAFDSLCHSLIKFGFDKVYKEEWAKTERFDNFLIPMSVIKAVKESEDEKYYEDYLNEKISPMTFLDPSILKDNLNLIYPEMLKEIARETYPNDKQPLSSLKKDLKGIYGRRNFIVHQDDREHKTLEKRSITKMEVEKTRDSLISVARTMIELIKDR